jgi:hypothetical protein
MSSPTFEESFCEQHGIERERFARVVFKQVLYRRARAVGWLFSIFNGDYFSADYELINAVAHLRRLREFTHEADRFNYHPANRGWFRRKLCIRVSTNRLRLLIKATLPHSSVVPNDSGAGTAIPFESEPAPKEPKTDFMPTI